MHVSFSSSHVELILVELVKFREAAIMEVSHCHTVTGTLLRAY